MAVDKEAEEEIFNLSNAPQNSSVSPKIYLFILELKIDTQKIKMKSKSCFSSSRFVKVGAMRNLLADYLTKSCLRFASRFEKIRFVVC